MMRQVIRRLAADDAEGTVAWLEENGYGENYDWLRADLAIGWAERDPKRALLFYDEKSDGSGLFYLDPVTLNWLGRDMYTREMIYSKYATLDLLGAIEHAQQSKTPSHRASAFVGVSKGLTRTEDFSLVAKAVDQIVQDSRSVKRNDIDWILDFGRISKELAMNWANVSVDDAMEWYVETRQNRGVQGNYILPSSVSAEDRQLKFLQVWADHSPKHVLRWAEKNDDKARRKDVVRMLGQTRYDLALELVQKEPDPEKRFELAIYGTKRKRIVGKEDVPVLYDLPFIGRLFPPFDLDRVDDFIKQVKESSLDGGEKERVIGWLVEKRAQYDKAQADVREDG